VLPESTSFRFALTRDTNSAAGRDVVSSVISAYVQFHRNTNSPVRLPSQQCCEALINERRGRAGGRPAGSRARRKEFISRLINSSPSRLFSIYIPAGRSRDPLRVISSSICGPSLLDEAPRYSPAAKSRSALSHFIVIKVRFPDLASSTLRWALPGEFGILAKRSLPRQDHSREDAKPSRSADVNI